MNHHSMNRGNRPGMINAAALESADVSGLAGRPLAHAIALRLLTSKGADAVGLKAYVARAGLGDAMVDVLEELNRRVRGLRVEFEEIANTARAATPAPAPAAAPVEPADHPAPQPTAAPATPPRTPHPGW